MPAQGKPQAQVIREAFFVQVPAPDGTIAFHDVTGQIGKAMPFTKPKATCAMQVSSVPVAKDPVINEDGTEEPQAPTKRGVVAFSLLHLTKKSASSVVDAPMSMPRGPLARLVRKGASLIDITPDQVVAEVTYTDKDNEAVTLTSVLSLARDASGIVTLDSDEPGGFELPPRALRISLFLVSPVAGQRVLAVGFIGHLGRPGDPTTITLVASKVLFSISQLTEFRILSGIETVSIPSAPNRHMPKAVVRKPGDQAVIAIPTRLYRDPPPANPVAEGEVVVEIDLEHANPSSNRLLFHIHPDEALTEAFEAFRPVFDSAINSMVIAHLGPDDVANITYDIVLGDVDSRTIERLKEALATMSGGLDCTPALFRNRTVATS